MTLDELDPAALYELTRALADRGTDFGVDVYRHYSGGATGFPSGRNQSVMVLDDPADDSAVAWLRAFAAARSAYFHRTGKVWRY